VKVGMRVVIVDDDQLVALSLKTILEANEEISVVGTGNDGTEAVVLYEKERPDILLMDIQMKPMSGLAAAEQILKTDRDAKILFLTSGWANVSLMRLSRIATSAVRRATAIPTVKMMAATCFLFSVQYVRKNTKVVVVRFAAKKARYRLKNSDAVGQDVKMAIRSLISLVDV
jgi:chemotaxis response regulator CheB